MLTRPDPEQFKEGDRVRIVKGAYEGYVGAVTRVDPDVRLLRVLVPFFGQLLPVDLAFDEVEKL